MLGIKKFGFYVLALLLVPAAIVGIMGLASGTPATLDVFTATDLGIAMAILCLVCLGLMLHIRQTTKCPQCKKVWVGKRLANEDLGTSSGVFTKKCGNEYCQYQKHKHRLSYKCISCGHEWEKIVEKDHRL